MVYSGAIHRGNTAGPTADHTEARAEVIGATCLKAQRVTSSKGVNYDRRLYKRSIRIDIMFGGHGD